MTIQRCVSILFFFFLFGCSQKTPTKVYFHELKVDSSENNLINPDIVNSVINPGCVEINSKYYLYYLNKNYFLQFINPEDLADTFSLKLPNQKNVYRDNLIFINSSSINLLDVNNFLLIRLDYSTDGIKKNSKQIDLNPIFDNKKILLYPNHLSPFYIDNNYVYIPFFKKQHFNNFPLRHVFKKILLTDNNISEEIFTLPDEIISKKRFNRTSQILPISQNIVGCFFSESDRVEFFDKRKEKIILSKNFTPFSNFEDFDNSRNDDLSYVRFYSINNERNFYFGFENKIFVLKKMRSSAVEKNYEYYILDSSLTLLHFGKITNTIRPILIPSSNGFSLISEDYKKVFSYHY